MHGAKKKNVNRLRAQSTCVSQNWLRTLEAVCTADAHALTPNSTQARRTCNCTQATATNYKLSHNIHRLPYLIRISMCMNADQTASRVPACAMPNISICQLCQPAIAFRSHVAFALQESIRTQSICTTYLCEFNDGKEHSINQNGWHHGDFIFKCRSICEILFGLRARMKCYGRFDENDNTHDLCHCSLVRYFEMNCIYWIAIVIVWSVVIVQN